MNGQHFLALANNFDSQLGRYDLNCSILRRDAVSQQFVGHQLLPCNGATSLAAFQLGSELHLAIANSQGGLSVVFRWQGSRFVEVQHVSVNEAQQVHFFSAPNGLSKSNKCFLHTTVKILLLNSPTAYLIFASTASSLLLAWDVNAKRFVPVWSGLPSYDLHPLSISQPSQPLLLIAQANSQFEADGIRSTVLAFSTADNASDFISTTTTLTFLPDQAQISARVWLTDDRQPEGEEHFTVQLARPRGGAELGGARSVRVDILANDDAFGVIEFALVRRCYS